MDLQCCTNDASGQQEQGQSEDQAGVNSRTNDVSGQQEQGQSEQQNVVINITNDVSEQQEEGHSEEQTGVIKFIRNWLTGVIKFIRKWEAFSPPKAEEWETIYRPMAQAIIILVLYRFSLLIYRRPSENTEVNWGDQLPILILYLAAAVSFSLSFVALMFPYNMTNIDRCQQVRSSFLCLLTGIIVALTTSLIHMATG